MREHDETPNWGVARWLRGFYSLYYGGLGAYAPFINLYLSRQLGLSAALIGTLSGIASAVPLLAQPLWCRKADAVGKRETLMPVLAVSAAAVLLYGAARSFDLAVVAACLAASSVCAIAPIMDSMTIMLLKNSSARLTFADIRLWGSAGFVITAALSGFIYMRLGNLRPIFASFACAMFVVVGLLYRSRSRMPEEPKAISMQATAEDEEHPAANPGLSLWKSPVARVLLMACFMNQLATVSGSAYIGIFTSHLGGSYFQVGLLSAIAAIMEVPAGLLLGRIAGRVGINRVLGVAFALNALRWYLISMVGDPSALYAIQMLGGIIFIAYYSSAVTLIDGLSPKGGKSSGQSTFWIFTSGISSLVGSPVGGLLFDSFGPSFFYKAVSVTALAAVLLWLPHMVPPKAIRTYD